MNTVGNLINKIYGNESRDEREQLMARLEDEFTKDSEQAIDDLYKYIRTAPISRWSRTAMQILQRIGFPANQKAFSIIVGWSGASNLNSPACEIAFEIAKEIGEPIIPEIRNALHFYSQDLYEYRFEIQGLCTLLDEMGSPVIDPLLPELLQLLEAGTDKDYVVTYALWPLRRIGSPTANTALPIIHEKIISSSSEHIKKVLLDALHDFEPLALRQFIPVLEECLSDESEIIRDKAQKVLERIENNQTQ